MFAWRSINGASREKGRFEIIKSLSMRKHKSAVMNTRLGGEVFASEKWNRN
jgi:hypothetical protein